MAAEGQEKWKKNVKTENDLQNPKTAAFLLPIDSVVFILQKLI